jgi:hypothetical protein
MQHNDETNVVTVLLKFFMQSYTMIESRSKTISNDDKKGENTPKLPGWKKKIICIFNGNDNKDRFRSLDTI